MIKPKIVKVLHNPLQHPIVIRAPYWRDGVPRLAIRLPPDELHDKFFWKEFALSNTNNIQTALGKMFESHFISKFYD